jgi:ribosome biogenesis GTPase
MDINKLGWNDSFQMEYDKLNDKNYLAARVIREEKGHYLITYIGGDVTAEICGKLRHRITDLKEYPSVGDWVLIKLTNNKTHGIIYHVLKRKSCFTRKAAISGGRKVREVGNQTVILGGATEEQVIASNIDTVFIVMACDDDFSLHRLERYLLLTYNSGANPVILLNKIDLIEDANSFIKEIESIALGADIHAISALEKKNIDVLHQYLSEGKTVGLFGSSGVGKSTIINQLLGTNKLLTNSVREVDGKGRHTTTWRELVLLENGGILIDTPGMRELQLWIDDDALSYQFSDIEDLMTKCKFRNCTHHTEPGCEVNHALEDGTLDQDRYHNYLILQSEKGYLDKRRREKEIALMNRKYHGNLMKHL